MSTSSLSTEEDLAVAEMYVENGKLKFKQYGDEYDIPSMDQIPIYNKFRSGFSAPSLREVAHSELEAITRNLMDVGLELKGKKNCAKHTGLFNDGDVAVDAADGVLVRLTESKAIKGKIGGSDSNFPGCVLVRSKPTDGYTTLQPDVNYIIHGDDSDDSDDSDYPENWVEILRDKNSFSRLTGLEAPVDVEVGHQLLFVDGKYKRQIRRGSMTNPGASKRATLVDVPEDWDTITVTSSDFFFDYSISKRVIKAIKLCNRLGQPLEISTIVEISQQTIENVIAVIVRCSSDLVGDIAVNGCMLGLKKGDGATNFRTLPELTFRQLQRTMVRLHGSDGLYIHRTIGAIEVEVNGQIGHIQSGNGAMAPYEGTVKWAG